MNRDEMAALREALAAVRMPHRQGDLHNYGWNDAVTASLRAFDAALAAADRAERGLPLDVERLRDVIIDLGYTIPTRYEGEAQRDQNQRLGAYSMALAIATRYAARLAADPQSPTGE